MLAPYVVSTIFVLAIVILCVVRPNAGRIFLGFFYLAMAIGVNGFFLLTYAQGYEEYLSGALLPLYQELTARTVALYPVFYGLLLFVFEVAMGLLLLSKRIYVKIGLLGTTIFLMALAPVSTLQWPWLGLAAAQIYLLTKEFDRSLVEMLRSRG